MTQYTLQVVSQHGSDGAEVVVTVAQGTKNEMESLVVSLQQYAVADVTFVVFSEDELREEVLDECE